MKKLKVLTVLYYIIQWTWGLPQNLLGLLLTVIVRLSNKGGIHERYRNAVLTDWKKKGWSMGLGMFVFYGHRDCTTDVERMIRAHEYGHTIQSVVLGPLFLPVIGIPSLVWANLPYFRQFRAKKHYDYYRFYPEAWANKAGAWANRLGDYQLPQNTGVFHA